MPRPPRPGLPISQCTQLLGLLPSLLHTTLKDQPPPLGVARTGQGSRLASAAVSSPAVFVLRFLRDSPPGPPRRKWDFSLQRSCTSSEIGGLVATKPESAGSSPAGRIPINRPSSAKTQIRWGRPSGVSRNRMRKARHLSLRLRIKRRSLACARPQPNRSDVVIHVSSFAS